MNIYFYSILRKIYIIYIIYIMSNSDIEDVDWEDETGIRDTEIQI
jgi:hypothetical protein